MQGDQPSERAETGRADATVVAATHRQHRPHLLHVLHHLRHPRRTGDDPVCCIVRVKAAVMFPVCPSVRP